MNERFKVITTVVDTKTKQEYPVSEIGYMDETLFSSGFNFEVQNTFPHFSDNIVSTMRNSLLGAFDNVEAFDNVKTQNEESVDGCSIQDSGSVIDNDLKNSNDIIAFIRKELVNMRREWRDHAVERIIDDVWTFAKDWYWDSAPSIYVIAEDSEFCHIALNYCSKGNAFTIEFYDDKSALMKVQRLNGRSEFHEAFGGNYYNFYSVLGV